MAASALCLVPLMMVAATLAAPQNFFYQSAFQPAPFHHQVLPQPFFGSFGSFGSFGAPGPRFVQAVQAVQPVPLALSSSAPWPAFVPAIPTHPIYSHSQPGRLLQGYSYETSDAAGGHGQVIYVAGPNSQQLFLENAKAFHFALPNSEQPKPEQKGVEIPKVEQPKVDQPKPEQSDLPDIDLRLFSKENKEVEKQAMQQSYFRATVLPQSRAEVGASPLFIYSVQTQENPISKSTLAQKEDEKKSMAEKADENEADADKNEVSTTDASPASESETTNSSDSQPEADASSTSESDTSSSGETTSEKSESSTEIVEKSQDES